MTSLLFEIRSIHYQLLFFPPRARFSLSLVLFIDFHYMRNFSPVGISRAAVHLAFGLPLRAYVHIHQPEEASSGGTIALAGIYSKRMDGL